MAAGILLAACGSDSPSTNAQASGPDRTTTTMAAGGDAYGGPTKAPDTTQSAMSTVAVADNPDFGKILVGPNGRTLYLFEKDKGTTTACTGGCIATWPALTADGQPTGGQGVDAGELSTATGIAPNQVVYHGHLLYYFAGDQAAGDVNGVKIPEWYPVSPSGEKIDRD